MSWPWSPDYQAEKSVATGNFYVTTGDMRLAKASFFSGEQTSKLGPRGQGGGRTRHTTLALASGLTLSMAKMRTANAYLIGRGGRAVLVDTGNSGDLPLLEDLLCAQGLEFSSISVVVLTHGHADHAGSAHELQARGIPIVAGRGDATMLARGRNAELVPQCMLARVLIHFIEHDFTPVKDARWVDGPMTLEPWGFADIGVEPLPGHTPGSLAITLPGNAVVAGDAILGGFLNGALWPHRPQVHYFHDDADASRPNLEFLLARGARQLFVGHGGPLSAEAVRSWLMKTRPARLARDQKGGS
jgi:hydroxyacylglutathione hydrolase